MAVKLRLQRHGTVKRPYYRVVAADAKQKRDGRYLEIIGSYDPTNDSAVTLDEARALDWLSRGAQPTATVKNILSKAGIIAKHKQNNK